MKTLIGRKKLSSLICKANEWSWVKYSKNSNKNKLSGKTGFGCGFSKEIDLAQVV